MEKYKRIFVIVVDSLGVGAMEDSPEFGDVGVNTLGHISEAVEIFRIPNLQKLGMANLTPLKQVQPVEVLRGYYGTLREKSRGKDTMTGHWEMMGLEVTKPDRNPGRACRGRACPGAYDRLYLCGLGIADLRQ